MGVGRSDKTVAPHQEGAGWFDRDKGDLRRAGGFVDHVLAERVELFGPLLDGKQRERVGHTKEDNHGVIPLQVTGTDGGNGDLDGHTGRRYDVDVGAPARGSGEAAGEFSGQARVPAGRAEADRRPGAEEQDPVGVHTGAVHLGRILRHANRTEPTLSSPVCRSLDAVKHVPPHFVYTPTITRGQP